MELSYCDYNTDCKLADIEESTAHLSNVKTVNFGRSKQNTRQIVSFARANQNPQTSYRERDQ
jgi:hypothetical protein